MCVFSEIHTLLTLQMLTHFVPLSEYLGDAYVACFHSWYQITYVFSGLTLCVPAYLNVSKYRGGGGGGGHIYPLCMQGLVWVGVPNPFLNYLSRDDFQCSKGFMKFQGGHICSPPDQIGFLLKTDHFLKRYTSAKLQDIHPS